MTISYSDIESDSGPNDANAALLDPFFDHSWDPVLREKTRLAAAAAERVHDQLTATLNEATQAAQVGGADNADDDVSDDSELPNDAAGEVASTDEGDARERRALDLEAGVTLDDLYRADDELDVAGIDDLTAVDLGIGKALVTDLVELTASELDTAPPRSVSTHPSAHTPRAAPKGSDGDVDTDTDDDGTDEVDEAIQYATDEYELDRRRYVRPTRDTGEAIRSLRQKLNEANAAEVFAIESQFKLAAREPEDVSGAIYIGDLARNFEEFD